jgi:L-asparagine transporter-like permease
LGTLELESIMENFEAKEHGLKRELSARLLGMIAIGQSIGTGLFLGSGIAVQLAGPGVILSYIIGAFITFLVMLALSEMTAAHPMAGSFGAYAEHYLGPWAGWVTRYTYCTAQIIAIGSQIVAVAIYCRFWFPDLPAWVWIVGFSILLIGINILNVGNFGEFEYWFSLIKVLAICLLLVFGFFLFTGIGVPRQSLEAYTAHGGFMPRGLAGVWAAVTMAVFSFYGLEAAAVSSGEAKDPQRSVPQALRSIMIRLAIFYIGSMTILVGVVPWNQTGIHESPFVLVYQKIGIPGAAGLMNFVVLTAALTSINVNLYTASRMLFSLSRSGQAPAVFGKLSRQGVPRSAVLVSGAGLVVAAVVYQLFADSAFVYMLGIALFGGIFCWLMIFSTHLRFRRAGIPYGSLVGFLLLLAVLITMAFLPDMRIAWLAGVPWMLFLSIAYWLKKRRVTGD